MLAALCCVRYRLRKKGRGIMRLILDPCCGPKTWLGGNKDRYVTCDILPSCSPDVVADMRFLPFADGVFDALRFDPPHLIRNDVKSWNPAYLKYGHWKNRRQWCNALYKVNDEFHRVTKDNATLLVKIIDGKDKRTTKRQDLWHFYKWNIARQYETKAMASWSNTTTLWTWFRKKQHEHETPQ